MSRGLLEQGILMPKIEQHLEVSDRWAKIQLWSRHYLPRIVPMEISAGAEPPKLLFKLSGTPLTQFVANASCPGAWGAILAKGEHPNTIPCLLLIKVGRKVQPSRVFARNSPFDRPTATPTESRCHVCCHVFTCDVSFFTQSHRSKQWNIEMLCN